MPRGDPRRRDAAAADPPQPAVQRGEVHRGRRGRAHRQRRSAVPVGEVELNSRCATPASASGGRHGAAVPVVLAGGFVHHAQVRRHRPGPGDQQAAGRADGRAHVGRERGPARARHSYFTLRAPLAELPPQTAGATSSATQPELQGKRVLIVDDNATNRRVSRCRRAMGHAAARHRIARRGAAAGSRRRTVRRRDPRHAHAGMDGVGWRARSSRADHALPLVLFSSLGGARPAMPTSLFSALR